MLVSKLRGTRERNKRETGKCGGRKNYLEIKPEAEALAKKLKQLSGQQPHALAQGDRRRIGGRRPRHPHRLALRGGRHRPHGRSPIVIRIAISQAAFEAIARTLPLGSVSFENRAVGGLVGRAK
jgi:hypothetical protein